MTIVKIFQFFFHRDRYPAREYGKLHCPFAFNVPKYQEKVIQDTLLDKYYPLANWSAPSRNVYHLLLKSRANRLKLSKRNIRYKVCGVGHVTFRALRSLFSQYHSCFRLLLYALHAKKTVCQNLKNTQFIFLPNLNGKIKLKTKKEAKRSDVRVLTKYLRIY